MHWEPSLPCHLHGPAQLFCGLRHCQGRLHGANMVSTRSQSVLSADGGNGDTAATAGEVNSAAPTPRRSGRLRGAVTPTAAAQAPPASARAARSRRPLKAIAEEQEQADEQQAAQQQQEQQEQEGTGEHAAPRARRRRSGTAPAAAAVAAAQQEQQQEAEGEAAHAAEPAEEAAAAGAAAAGAAPEDGSDAADAGQAEKLKAGAAVVDLLAQQMFAALDGAFGVGAGSGSSSESDSEPEPGVEAADRQQQEQQPAAGAGHGSSDEGSDSEGDEQGHHVPAHLRWRPELTLPGMGSQQQRQRGSSGQAATAAAAAGAPGVHVVRRGGKDSLHVPPPDEHARAKAARKTAPDTTGKGWFDLPATKITDEVKSDLRMLRLRCGPCGLLLCARRIADVWCLPDCCCVACATGLLLQRAGALLWLVALQGRADAWACAVMQFRDVPHVALRSVCRGALDPKAHYKKLDNTKFPKYFQMGTVVEGAADYYSGARRPA